MVTPAQLSVEAEDIARALVTAKLHREPGFLRSTLLEDPRWAAVIAAALVNLVADQHVRWCGLFDRDPVDVWERFMLNAEIER